MPKHKRERIIRQPRLSWSDDDITHALGFLDYCLEYGVDFEDLVASHLPKVTGKAFTRDQITRKLKREWNFYGPDNSDSDYTELLREGSSVLSGYNSELKEDIRAAASRIAPPRVTRSRLRSLTSALTSRSRTLSKLRQLSDTSSDSSLSLHATPEFEGVHLDIGQPELEHETPKGVGRDSTVSAYWPDLFE
jgi:hypothetical protein